MRRNSLALKKHFKALSISTLILISAGCAQVGKQLELSKVKADVSELVQQKEALPTLIFIRENAPALSAYQRFTLNPINVDFSNRNIQEISREDVEKMQSYLHKVMKKSLENGGYDVSSSPTKDSLEIQFTIRDMKLPNAAANVSMLVVPGLSTSVGEVTLEATFTDSNTQKLNAVVVESTRGSYMFNGNPLTTTSDVIDAFDNWAEGFRRSLDLAHRKSQNK